MEKKVVLYSMDDVVRITGISKDTIRNWTKDFNIQLERTPGGHRRFSEENIQVLKAIEEKKDVNGWSMKQIGAWLNGELTPEVIAGTEVKTNLEKKFENLQEVVMNQNQLLEAIGKQLVEQEKRHQQQLLEQEDRIVTAIERRLADPIERRTLELSNSLSLVMEERRKEVAAALEKEESEAELKAQSSFFSKLKSLFKA